MTPPSSHHAGPAPLTREAADALAAALAAEMIQLWRRGERVLPEDFLARHPGLWEYPEAVAELIYEEMSLRREYGPDVPTEEVLRRFPRRRQREVLFDCHRVLTPRPAARFPAAGEPADGFGLKFFAAVRLCRAAWPHLVARRGGVVNVAGVGGRTGSADFTIGGSVNAALLNLTKCLADRGVRDGVRVNAINPGSIRTDRLTARIRAGAQERGVSEDEAARRMTERMGIARFGDPAEVAEVVGFLAGDGAAYLQGAVLDVDGGLTRTL